MTEWSLGWNESERRGEEDTRARLIRYDVL